MSHTNSTTNYNLPQFITTDKPAWLTDVNNAYSAIDLGMHAAKTAADSAQGDATQALTDAGNAQTTANTADSKSSGAIASISENFDSTSTYAVGDLVMYNHLLYKCHTAIVTPGAWSGSANWTRVTVDDLYSELKGTVPHNLNDLSNVTAPAPTQNQALVYDGSKWANANVDYANLANAPTVVTQNITINGDVGVTGSGTITVWGKIVTLSASLNYAAAGTNLRLAWLSGGVNNPYRPSAAKWLSCDVYDSSGKTAEAQIKANGDIEVSQPEGNKNLKISGVWICEGFA